MALYAIELNDAGVRVIREGKIVCESPGFAIIENNAVVTGVDAQSRAHLNPRAVNNRFWQQLNEAKLPNATRQCRHHADLAYHHLKSILHQVGRPSDAVFSVPGHYNDEQLALLLGIAEACGLKISGLVDSSVAAVASCAPQGHYTVADIHQHHLTLTTVEVDKQVRRTTVDAVDQSGVNRIYEACVDLIADAFLEQSRFDPLHEADTEQLLYSHLPKWLDEATKAQEIQISVEYRGNRFSVKIPTRAFERVTEMVLAPVRDHLSGKSQLLLCASLAQLPGCMNYLAPAQVLKRDASYRGVAEHRLELMAGKTGVSFVTSLPPASSPSLDAFSTPASEAADTSRNATHLLAGSYARALSSNPIYLVPDGTIASTADGSQSCAITLDEGIATLRVNGADTRLNGESVSGSCQIKPGDHITLQGGRALFIPIAVSDYRAP